MTLRRIIVSLDMSKGKPRSGILAKLRGKGLTVENAMLDMGVVTGSFSGGDTNQLRSVPGVKSIEEDRIVSVPPPNSDEPS
jgi:hypothetical protein